MGHIRLGRLPKSRIWREVVELLDQAPEDIPGIAATVLEASAGALSRNSTIDSASHAFFVLLRLAGAAENGDIAAEFQRQGVAISPGTPMLAALADLGDRLRERAPGGDHYGDFAALALRRALMETVGTQGPSLFGSTVEQLGEGFRNWTGGEQFGRLTRLFFGDFIARSLHAAVDRELSNHVGAAGTFADASQSRAFDAALDRYARETAVIVQRFAVDWYAKHHWQTKQSLRSADARAFSSVALKKLRSDLTLARTNA